MLYPNKTVDQQSAICCWQLLGYQALQYGDPIVNLPAAWQKQVLQGLIVLQPAARGWKVARSLGVVAVTDGLQVEVEVASLLAAEAVEGQRCRKST